MGDRPLSVQLAIGGGGHGHVNRCGTVGFALRWASSVPGCAWCRSAFVVHSAPADEAVARGTISFLVIAVPIAAGLYALRVPESARFGFALVAAGLAWSTTALGESSESLPYSIGRVVALARLPEPHLPDARVPAGTDWPRSRARALPRADRGAGAVVPRLGAGGRAATRSTPRGRPVASDCPPNAFLLLSAGAGGGRHGRAAVARDARRRAVRRGGRPRWSDAGERPRRCCGAR